MGNWRLQCESRGYPDWDCRDRRRAACSPEQLNHSRPITRSSRRTSGERR